MIRDMKAAALDGLRFLPLFLGFIGLYYVLDKVSFGHPLFGPSITPWNPAPALGLVLVMRVGRAAWAPLTIAVLLAEIGVHGHFTSLWIHVLPGLVLALGYAGWAPGQLEHELEQGWWHVVRASYGDVYDPDPDTLWRRVLRRQGGELALLATWTATPEQN